jgi:hypothetical protein
VGCAHVIFLGGTALRGHTKRCKWFRLQSLAFMCRRACLMGLCSTHFLGSILLTVWDCVASADALPDLQHELGRSSRTGAVSQQMIRATSIGMRTVASAGMLVNALFSCLLGFGFCNAVAGVLRAAALTNIVHHDQTHAQTQQADRRRTLMLSVRVSTRLSARHPGVARAQKSSLWTTAALQKQRPDTLPKGEVARRRCQFCSSERRRATCRALPGAPACSPRAKVCSGESEASHGATVQTANRCPLLATSMPTTNMALGEVPP